MTYDFIIRRHPILRRFILRFLSCSIRMSMRYGLFTFVAIPPTKVRAKKLRSKAHEGKNIGEVKQQPEEYL